jgi:hypothetical protein
MAPPKSENEKLVVRGRIELPTWGL